MHLVLFIGPPRFAGFVFIESTFVLSSTFVAPACRQTGHTLQLPLPDQP
jgi:hypothetical protein